MQWRDAMMHTAKMRTTVNIDDDLLEQLRAISASTRQPLGELVDDALRLMLSRRQEGPRRELVLPAYGQRGLHPGVDLEDKEAVADLLGDNRRPRASG